ncbi:chloramphenicol phosphotransferase [Agrobacterium vitis]|uniref:chloramphenicol phosphotransferase CPT family protein n=1 Tax=Agrobacterium vitis TaxID=373 RepID=UPI0015DD44B8|nr:chloramphenicol phosphotransferase [Agrobacterium vitis]BCH63444.1 chloramphenicol phosphotransferase [Agrobacterium vitis]
METAGQILILNGAPRSGKSSIAKVVLDSFPGLWVNLGVDAKMATISERHRPGIGLRPGGDPEKEETVQQLYAALHETIAAHSRLGINVVVDVGYHQAYSRPLHILDDCARRLAGLPVLFIGVHCALATIMARRAASPSNGAITYLQGSTNDPVPEPVQRWQMAVHEHGPYDLDVDTTDKTPEDCAREILTVLGKDRPQPSFFERRLSLIQT